MRPIDADALIEKCGGWYVDECTESGFIGTLKDLLATEPTIQPEKAQLSQEGTTSDLISRQAAIDALIGISGSKSIEELTEECEVYQSDNRCYSGGVYGAIRAIKTLPTIQPQSTTGQLNDGAQSTDLIDRQAAIDAVEKNACNTQRIMDAVNNLPPAQPEPQEGRWINGKCDLCGEHAPFWCMASTYHESNFCPNCGAKMKGE